MPWPPKKLSTGNAEKVWRLRPQTPSSSQAELTNLPFLARCPDQIQNDASRVSLLQIRWYAISPETATTTTAGAGAGGSGPATSSPTARNTDKEPCGTPAEKTSKGTPIDQGTAHHKRKNEDDPGGRGVQKRPKSAESQSPRSTLFKPMPLKRLVHRLMTHEQTQRLPLFTCLGDQKEERCSCPGSVQNHPARC